MKLHQPKFTAPDHVISYPFGMLRFVERTRAISDTLGELVLTLQQPAHDGWGNPMWVDVMVEDEHAI